VQLNSDSTASVDLTIDIKGAIAGTNDSLTLTTDKNGADLKSNAVTVKAGGVETINVASSSETGADAFNLGGITDAQLTTINVSGKGAVDLGTIAAAGVTTVNAANASGGVTADLSNSTKAVTFTGGDGADVYTASTMGDTIYGGKGADTITLSTGADVLVYKAAAESTATTKDTINSFNVTADLIKFDASLLKGTATYLGAGAFTAGGSTELNFSGSDLQVDLNGDGTADMVITLTGVTSAMFGATNFTFA
jgi:Ca2+-binding RTX toxin-like protein